MSTDVMLIGSVVHNTGRNLRSGWVVHGTSKLWGKTVHFIQPFGPGNGHL